MRYWEGRAQDFESIPGGLIALLPTSAWTSAIATFDQVVHRIEGKDFSIAERPTKLCKGCDMRFYCDAKNWQFKG